MVVDLRPFDPRDADELVLQDAQVVETLAAPGWRSQLAQAPDLGPCWSAWGDDRLLGCGGMIQQWRGRATAWCYLGAGIPRAAWVSIHRAVRARLEQAPSLGLWRVEAHVMAGFLPGKRWAEMLGMELECLATGYLPCGGNAWLYARIFR